MSDDTQDDVTTQDPPAQLSEGAVSSESAVLAELPTGPAIEPPTIAREAFYGTALEDHPTQQAAVAATASPTTTITLEAVRRIRELTEQLAAPDQLIGARIRGLLPT